MKILLWILLILQIANILTQDQESEAARQKELELLKKQAEKNTSKEEVQKQDTVQPKTDLNETPISPIDPDPVDLLPLCNYADPVLCQRDRNCIWDKTLNCTNKYDCSQIPLEQCNQNKLCHSTPSIDGYCSGPPAHCKPYNFIQCSKDPLCYWQTTSSCVPKDPQPAMPNCGAMSILQCIQNSQFCNLSGNCYDDKMYCSNLSYQQCIKEKVCHYTFTKERCVDNPQYCQSMGHADCDMNNHYCYTHHPGGCQNKYHCYGLSLQACDDNPTYCERAPPSAPLVCKDKYFGCENISNMDVCNQTPGCFQSNQIVCQPLLKHCKFNNKQDCLKDPSCKHIPAGGFCSQDMSFGCANLSLLQCYKNKYCNSTYQCTNKPIPQCNQLLFEECKKSPFCQMKEKGQCYDKKFECNLPYGQCVKTKPCQWHPGVQGQCVNNFQCNGLSEKDCYKNNNICNINITGHCRPK